jgi:hypothetical protein
MMRILYGCDPWVDGWRMDWANVLDEWMGWLNRETLAAQIKTVDSIVPSETVCKRYPHLHLIDTLHSIELIH